MFHLRSSINVQFDDLKDEIPFWLLEPSNSLFVLIGNHENVSTEAWKILVSENVNNVYMLEGGINFWMKVFTSENPSDETPDLHIDDDDLHYQIEEALGHRHDLSDPDPEDFDIEFIPKVKLELKKGPSGGGCG